MRVAIFGGSFNPPHHGHIGFCRLLLEGVPPASVRNATPSAGEKGDPPLRGGRLALDQVWMIPCYTHPFGKALAPFPDRVAMCEAAVPPDLEGRLLVSRVEEELRTGRTIDLIRHLLLRHPRTTFFLAIGSDILGEVHRWKAFGEIERLVPLIVIPRAGWERSSEEACLPDVRSSEIRRRVARGEPYDEFLPPAVAAYIEAHRLYRAPSPGA